MTEYIKKKHLLDFLDAVIDSEKDLNAQITAKAIKASINVMPSFNMKERKKGMWIETKFSRFTYYKCSVCNASYECENAEFDLNFCPNCGADMRGERNDQDI